MVVKGTLEAKSYSQAGKVLAAANGSTMGLYAYPSATLLSQQSVKMPFPHFIVWSPILWAPDDQ